MVRDYSSIARALMGEWNKTSQPLKERASVLPLGQYEDGTSWGLLGLASWPLPLKASKTSARRRQHGMARKLSRYLSGRMAFDAAGGAMTGGLASTGVGGGLVR
jgi:hypothetical protein